MTFWIRVARHWKLLVGGLAIALLGAALAFAKMDARHYRKVADQRRDVILRERQAHKVTEASLAGARAAIDRQNREIERRAKAFTDAQTTDRQTIAAMDARRRADGNRVATLAALAKTMPPGGCKAPAALLDNLKGL